MFISIIVPVYNAEKYIHDCMSSILERQDFRDFEVILIDDGSADGSPGICDKYAEKDSRVKVIHKKNGGASSARNAGLKKAAGKYILFVDSDDYINENSLGKIAGLIAEEGESDLIFLNAVSIFPNGSSKPREEYRKELFYRLEHKDVLNNIRKKLPDCLWDKIIKRDVIIDNDIYFTEGIICEDVDFMMKLFMHAETYNAAGLVHYYYRDGREGSVMNTRSEKLFTSLFHIISKWERLSQTEYREYRYIINGWLLVNYCWVLIPRYNILPKDIKMEYVKKVEELSKLFFFSKDKKVKLIELCCNLFGLNFTSMLMNIYYRIKDRRYASSGKILC